MRVSIRPITKRAQTYRKLQISPVFTCRKNNSVFANTPEFRDRIWFKLRRFNSPEYKHSADVDNLGIYTLMFFSGGLAYGGQGLFKNSLQVIGGDLYIYTDDDGWTSDSRHRDEFLNLFWYPILK